MASSAHAVSQPVSAFAASDGDPLDSSNPLGDPDGDSLRNSLGVLLGFGGGSFAAPSWHQAALTSPALFSPALATVSSLSALATSTADFTAAHAVTLTLDLSENAVVAGGTTLSLSDGGTATYASGSGTATIVFSYSATDAPGALSVTNVSAGSITDESSNPVALAGTAVSPYIDAITDTAAHVAAHFDSLNAAVAQISTITLTDGSTPDLDLTAAQALNDATLIAKIASPFHLVVDDTAANIAAHFDALEADAANIHAVDFTDAGTPTLALTQTQVTDDASLLAKVQGPYDLLVTGVDGISPQTGASGTPPHYSSYENLYDASNALTETIYFNDNGTKTFTFFGNALVDDSASTHNDFFDLGGVLSSTVTGGNGNDSYYFGAGFSSDDDVNGGGGTNNQIGLQGDYSGGLTLEGAHISNIQVVALLSGFDYNINTDATIVASGHTMTIWAADLAAANTLTFDGSAVTDGGGFVVFGGAGDDHITGSSGADTFFGLGGDDTFNLGADLTAADKIDGGLGSNTLNLDGDYTGGHALTFGAATMINVQDLVLAGGHSYDLTTNDATVASGATLTVDASALGAGDTLSFDGSAETNGAFAIIGGAGDDSVTIGSLAVLQNSTFDGDDGNNTLTLDGDFSAGFTFGPATIANVEVLALTAGHSYDLTTDDATVPSGGNLVVDASPLGAGDTLTFDGSAETDGSFQITGGQGDDVLTGGQFGDSYDLSLGGNDTVHAGAGLNAIYMGGALTAADTIDGGLGLTELELDGDYTGAHAVVFSATTITNVLEIDLDPGHSYDLTSNDATVAANFGLIVDGEFLGAGDSLTFDGSAETDGSFVLVDGLGDDTLTGGAGDDLLSFDGGGTDTGMGGGGDDFIDACGHLDTADKFDGGTGYDIVELTADETASGNYTGPDALHLTASMLANFEEMDLDGGGSYDITTVDATVAAGIIFTVDASGLDASESVTFDGSAETDGHFNFLDGSGDDTFTGGSQGDQYDISFGGNDTIHAGAGDDAVYVGAALTSADSIDGGGGNDLVELDGDYTGANAVVFSATTMVNVETLQLDPANSYDLTTDDATVGSGKTLTVDASALGSGDTLTFDGSAETDGHFDIIAGASLQATLTGGALDDTFDLSLAASAGFVQAFGGGGDDTFLFLDNFDSSGQVIDGGTGTNTLSLDGDYTSVSLVGGIIANIQTVLLAGGHSYTGVQIFDDISGGSATTIDATGLLAGDALSLDASASSDALILHAGDGTYTITGSAQDDTIAFAGSFNASDSIDGGAGNDTVSLDGDYSAGLVFGAATMTNVENLTLAAGHSYELTTDDANVGAGATLTVDASALGSGDTLTFDGSAETDGSFVVDGGAGADHIAGGDLGDTLTGGGGDDVFVYTSVAQSTGTSYDRLTDFDATADKFDLPTTVTGIDGLIASGTLDSGGSFNTELAAATAGLGAGHAVLFTPDTGTLAGHTFLVVDGNGTVGYQAGQDFVFDVTGANHLASLSTGDFI